MEFSESVLLTQLHCIGFKIGEPLFVQIDYLGILIYERGNTGLIYHEKIQLQGLS